MNAGPETFSEWRDRTSPSARNTTEPWTSREWIKAATGLGALAVVLGIWGGTAAAVRFGWLAAGSLVMAALVRKLPEARAQLAYMIIYGACLAGWITYRIIVDRFDQADAIGYGIGIGLALIAWAGSKHTHSESD